MKKFIVSDLHGNYLVYNNIMNYLDNLIELSNEDITLYINGDLIDRGNGSTEMLLDVKKRIDENDKLKIEYLCGNHELMMYQVFLDGTRDSYDLWMSNGGYQTEKDFNKLENNEKEELIEFISNLKIYNKFDETINNKKIVLAHAKCPPLVLNDCPYTIKNNTNTARQLTWARKNKFNSIGNPDYFTIVGHTYVNTNIGCAYYQEENYLNIDGGCAAYMCGVKEYDHTPLVEVENEKLTILTFNTKNEIKYGMYFIKDKFIDIEEDILEEKRKLLKRK